MTARSTNMTRFQAVTAPMGLTLKELQVFPSIFSSGAHPKMSDRYTFLSTADIIEPLLKSGYIVTHANQRATRQGHRDPRFTRHVIRMRRLKDKPVVGDVFPEIQLSNSHDGQSRLILLGGVLRLACLNGMATTTVNFPGISVFHRGELEPILARINEGIENAVSSLQSVEKMAAKKLTVVQQKNFAKRAADLVYDTVDFDTSVLLKPRRENDNGSELWLVYNRVQENLIRGGVEIQHQLGQARAAKTRGITHIRREIDVNLGLWQLATKLAA